VWIVQFQDLDQMLKATAFDNICFEHLCYYSLASFERLIQPYGLAVVDAEVRTINAGSYRLYIQHDAVSAVRHIGGLGRVEQLRAREAGCEDWQTLEIFAWRVGEARRQIQSAITATAPGTIDLYGASTKANTLLQYCGLDERVIRQAWERSPEKIGRTTVTGIPIVSEETGRADPPAALVAGIWQFREAILEREAAYLDQGGAILFPLPEVDLALRPKAVPA
jgi:NDP-4-keto-2,6-dideoxyhexose 3-C-methyltransferase